MKQYNFILFSLLLLLPVRLPGQKLEGKISDAADRDDLGVKNSDRLVVSFIGFRTDTISVGKDEEYITHKLEQQNETGEVTVTGKASGTYISRMDPMLTVKITGASCFTNGLLP